MEGKCKTKFEKWYMKKHHANIDNFHRPYISITIFYTLNKNMQWGVIVDFFDSVGVYIEQNQFIRVEEQMFGYDIQEHKGKCVWGVGDIYRSKNRKEARKAAIEKAVEIYNKQL